MLPEAVDCVVDCIEKDGRDLLKLTLVLTAIPISTIGRMMHLAFRQTLFIRTRIKLQEACGKYRLAVWLAAYKTPYSSGKRLRQIRQ